MTFGEDSVGHDEGVVLVLGNEEVGVLRGLGSEETALAGFVVKCFGLFHGCLIYFDAGAVGPAFLLDLADAAGPDLLGLFFQVDDEGVEFLGEGGGTWLR